MELSTIVAANLPIFIKLVVAIFFGGLLGIERSIAHKTAGLRTYAIVSLGSCLLIITASMAMEQYLPGGVNPLYVMAAVATGIGFLCGGVIIYHENKLEGLTTAAGMWVAAGLGMAVGFGYFTLAAMTTILTIFMFSAFVWGVEERFKKPDQI